MDLAIRNRVLGLDCYYETTVSRPHWLRLESSTRADVVVVGGGLAGLSCALELSQRHLDVVLLEAGRLCGDASGRNGGQALVGFGCDQAWLQEKLGKDDARLLLQMSIDSLDLMRERIQRHARDCEPVWSAMTVADRPAKARALRAHADHMRTCYQHDMLYLEGGQLRDHIGSERYVAALLEPGGHLNPLRYGLGIAQAAHAAGARLHEHSRALTLQREGAYWIVETPQARVQARRVVLAGNCGLLWQSPDLARPLHSRIMPVASYIVATEPLDPALANSLLPTRAAVCDNNFVLDYFRLTADHRMLFGGRVSYSTATPVRLRESMRQRMLRVFPQLAKTRIEHTWGGLIDITRERAPDWGQLHEEVYFLQGFCGHGLVATTLAAQVVAQAITGQPQALQLFERIRQKPFPGGPAWRIPLLLLGRTCYRLLDRLS